MSEPKESSDLIENESSPSPKCGIVMPIAAMDDCSEVHWSDVLGILTDAIEEAGFSANIVSNADEVTIIQKTIVQNLYELPVVVCDVSQKNPNVMFELGLRLAFDMPTIIVKDDKTSFSFDTGVIEHLEYPRDLRFNKIAEFKRKLGHKVAATYSKKINDPEYSTFLKHFGRFRISSLETTEVSSNEYIVAQLAEIKAELSEMSLPPAHRRPLSFPAGHEIDICCMPLGSTEVSEVESRMKCDDRLRDVRVAKIGEHFHVCAASDFKSIKDRRDLEREYQEVARELNRNQASKMLKLRHKHISRYNSVTVDGSTPNISENSHTA